MFKECLLSAVPGVLEDRYVNEQNIVPGMYPIVCSKGQQRGEVKTLTWTSGFCLGAGIKE